MSNQIVISSGAKVRNLDGVLTGTTGIVNSVPLGGANGVATLDSSGKVPVSQLPSSVVTYLGTWNAATNTPTLTNGVGDAGDMYLCNVAGTVDFGAGPISFNIGDWVLYGSGTWQKSNGQNGTVTSVSVTESGDALTITGSPITTSGTINIGFAGTSGQYVNGAGGLTTFPSLTGFVPYTGATSNVDLGTYGLLGDYIGFNTTPTSVPTTLGTLSWDSFYRTLQLIDGTGATTLQIGQEERTLVHNNTGSTLTDGQVVYVTGSTGELPSVALATNTTEAASSVTFGIVTESIANGADGFVTTSGMVHGLNTLAFNEGDALWLGSTAGTFTNIKPTAPANSVLVGYVIKKAGGNGSIFVKIQNGYELEELHDVSITSVVNNQGIFWDSATSLWKNKSIATALGYTPADDSLVVHLAGTETITGAKTFSGKAGFTNSNGTGFTYGIGFNKGFAPTGLVSSSIVNLYSDATDNNIVIKDNLSTAKLLFDNSTQTYTFPASSGTLALTSDLSSYVTLGTTQTISGAKTFSSSIVSDDGLKIKFGSASNLTANYLTLSAYGLLSPDRTVLRLGTTASTLSELIFSQLSSYQYTFPASSGTIALVGGAGVGTVTGTGTATRLAFWDGTSSISSNANLYWDNTNSRLGVGLTNPQRALEVYSATADSHLRLSGSAPSVSLGEAVTGSVYQAKFGLATAAGQYVSGAVAGDFVMLSQTGATIFATTATEKARITSGGNVGIGTSSPNSLLDVKGASPFIRITDSNPTGESGLIFDPGAIRGGLTINYSTGEFKHYAGVSGNGYFQTFHTNGSERMRITSGGNVCIGSTSAISTRQELRIGGNSAGSRISLGISGTNYSALVTDSGGNVYIANEYNDSAIKLLMINFNNGVYLSQSATSWTANSDERLKDINGTIKNAVDKLKTLRAVNFSWKSDENKKEVLGLIAQDVEKVFPQVIDKNKLVNQKTDVKDETEYLGVRYVELVPVLIAAIQEQQAQIELLSNKIVALESK